VADTEAVTIARDADATAEAVTEETATVDSMLVAAAEAEELADAVAVAELMPPEEAASSSDT